MKGFKAHIVKFLAVVMSMMYLLTPLHKEVESMLHGMSHIFEKPNVILSHHPGKHHSETKFEISKMLSHEHRVIDFIDNILGTDNQGEKSNNPKTNDKKVDKHFCPTKPKHSKSVVVTLAQISDASYKDELREGFHKKVKMPPKTIRIQLS